MRQEAKKSRRGGGSGEGVPLFIVPTAAVAAAAEGSGGGVAGSHGRPAAGLKLSASLQCTRLVSRAARRKLNPVAPVATAPGG